MKYARRTFAIVSTISIPHPAPISPMEAIVNPPSRGSRLDADHPQNGGLIPCRFTRCAQLFLFLEAWHQASTQQSKASLNDMSNIPPPSAKAASITLSNWEAIRRVSKL